MGTKPAWTQGSRFVTSIIPKPTLGTHLYRVKANICLGFVFMLTIVTVSFVSCFNICSEVVSGHHGHGASSDYGWRRRPLDVEGSSVCVQCTDASN